MADGTLIGILIVCIIGILLFLAYVFTLVKQAKKKEWIWFVLTLIFPVIVMIIYWLYKMFK